MHANVSGKVTWVGHVDWELRKFHGEEYTTARGSSYNAYLVRDEKTVLVETVWEPHAGAFMEDLERVVDLSTIDAVIAHHAEPDHGGALTRLMERISDVPVYCSRNGLRSLPGNYHRQWNLNPVKTGDRLPLGGSELVFIEAPMLHWPDSMFSYLTGENILFSNDAFGQHLASELRYDDQVDECELMQEALKYFANILTPFSALVSKKIEELKGLGLPVDMICPSHGVIWRANPMRIVEAYAEWAAGVSRDKVVILYDTMWNATRAMAEGLRDGLREASPLTEVKLYNTARSDLTEVMAEVFTAKAVLVGSSTVNRGMLSSVAAVIEMMQGLRFQRKKAAAFGSYGWSGEAPKLIAGRLAEGGFEVVGEPFRLMWRPGPEGLASCRAEGSRLAGLLG